MGIVGQLSSRRRMLCGKIRFASCRAFRSTLLVGRRPERPASPPTTPPQPPDCGRLSADLVGLPADAGA